MQMEECHAYDPLLEECRKLLAILGYTGHLSTCCDAAKHWMLMRGGRERAQRRAAETRNSYPCI